MQIEKWSKNKLFGMHLEINEDLLNAFKATPEIIAKGALKVAQFWHEKFLPRHFEHSARFAYGYARRSPNYRTQKKGWEPLESKQGKPDLVFTGSLKRDLTSRSVYIEGRDYVQLKMSARVLNFVPNISESNYALRVPHKNGSEYPNIKREVKAVIASEAEAMAGVMAKFLETEFRKRQQKQLAAGI